MAHPAFNLRSAVVLSCGYRGQGLKFTPDIHLVLGTGWSYTPSSPTYLHNIGIATAYGIDDLDIEPFHGRFSAQVQTRSGAYSASCTVNTAFPFRGKVARAGLSWPVLW